MRKLTALPAYTDTLRIPIGDEKKNEQCHIYHEILCDVAHYESDLAFVFAAAPDLLAACQAFIKEMNEKVIILGWPSLERYQQSQGQDDVYTLITAAIAKAITRI
jgi:hypothetical protein